MSNAVKSLSAPLAQCVKHRSSNQTLTGSRLFILVGWGRSFLSVAWPTGVQLMFFFSSGVSKLFGAQGSPSSGSLLNL